MGTVDGVAADFLHGFQTAQPNLLWHCHTQTAGILVQAHALQLHVLAVQVETGIGIEANLTESERCLYFIRQFAFAIIYLRKESVERRRFRAPKLWILHLQGGGCRPDVVAFQERNAIV